MVWGIFRAHLLLPSSAADWPEARLRGVLLHELAHLRRRDPLALLVAQLALALHWFNPLAWFAVRRLRAEQERACDDFVLRHGIRPSEYATDLLAVATGLRAQPFAAAALTMAHPARIEGRIAGILDAARNRATLTRRIICAAAFLAAAIALPLAMLRAAEEKKPAVASGKPHIVLASIAEQQLQLEVSAGQVPLTFRVGGEPGARRFAHRVGENAQRKLSVAFFPDAGPLWERLEIRYAGHAPHRLPPLRKDFLPDGEWKWRATASREGERFTFADVLLADGRKLPVSVEVGEVADVEEVPFMRVTGLVECEFRFYGVADVSLKEPATMKLAAAGKLVAGAAMTLETLLKGTAAVSAPRVTTRSGQHATIEIIREFRHEVKPGEWETDDMGVICEIEPEMLDKEVAAEGKVSLALYEGKYASLDEAIAKAMSKEATAPATAKVRRLEKEFSTALAEDEALVVPLPSEGMFPGAAVAVVTMKPIHPADVRSTWQPKSERAKNRISIESWLITVPASARAEMVGVLPTLKVGAEPGAGMLDDEKFQALQACAAKNTAVKIEQLVTVVAQPEEAVLLERGEVRVEFKADRRLRNPQVELEISAPMARLSGSRKVSTFLVVPPGSIVSFPCLPTVNGSPQRVLLIRPKPQVEPATLPQKSPGQKGGAKAKSKDDSSGIASVPVTPTTTLESRKTGLGLEVQPVVGPDSYTIDLSLAPQVVEFEGFIRYGSPIGSTRTVITPNVINQPIFSTRKVAPGVSIFDGQSVLIGGLIREDAPTAAAPALPLAPPTAADEKIPTGAPAQSPPGIASVTGVATTSDSAEISVDVKRGGIAFVVGEGAQARVIVHEFGSARGTIVLRVSADDRQGKWWDQARVVRASEGEALFPELPEDWLPRGRVVFLPAPVKRADGAVIFAEIESAAGKVALAVRAAGLGDVGRAQAREIPRTSPESEIVFDCRIYALAANAPAKTVTLPVMAAQDLTGSPRGALCFPYITLRAGLPGHFDRMAGRAEEVKVTAKMESGRVQVDGTVLVRLIEGKFASAADALRQVGDLWKSDPRAVPAKQLRAEFSATLGGNDALVVPIASEGAFPETLVASMTALPRRLSRVRWQPPGARAPIALDGWVLTWPRADEKWFASHFDYDGLPSMIARDLEARKDTSTKGIGSEAVGTLKQDEVEKLLAGFRQRAGVTAERVEPFSVKQHLSSISTSSDRTHFSVAGEGASVLPYTDEQYVSLFLEWDAPVLRHLSASDPYGLTSGTSLCVLLPGPADPEKIRMLVLRCVNPDAAPRAKSGGGAAPPNAAHSDDLR